MTASAGDAAPVAEPMGQFRVILPSGQPLEVHIVVDGRLDALVDLFRRQDPVELERAAFARDDFDDDEQSGFAAALLRELADRAVEGG